MNTPSPKTRLAYRFDNYQRAFNLLREAIETMQTRQLNPLEKEGIIQRFEYSWELAWKVLKDYLEVQGVHLETVTPSSVIKAAYSAKIIEHGEAWMKALDARNKMFHTYDSSAFEGIIEDIRLSYFSLLESLYNSISQTIKTL